VAGTRIEGHATERLRRLQGLPVQGCESQKLCGAGSRLRPEKIAVLMVSEAAPARRKDYYYAGGDSLFEQTTLQAFNDAGAGVTSFRDILNLGVYFTTAVKCGKTGYGLESNTIDVCSRILEQELALFPAARVLLLMGDVAIKAINCIARRAGAKRVIPPAHLQTARTGIPVDTLRVFPVLSAAGPSFS